MDHYRTNYRDIEEMAGKVIAGGCAVIAGVGIFFFLRLSEGRVAEALGLVGLGSVFGLIGGFVTIGLLRRGRR